jgi:glutamate/tyrosine decarboxylase-like PLP-dependent enzyme
LPGSDSAETIASVTERKNTDPLALLAADRADFADLSEQVTQMVGEYLNALPDEAAQPVIPEKERELLSSLALPEQGLSAEEILRFMETHILPWPQPTGHPRSYAWVNSPPLPIAIIAETVAQAMNSSLDGFDYSGLFLMVSLERWLMELVGFPQGEQSLALLFSGGSAASLNALTVARYRAAREDGWNVREEGLQGNRPAMLVYASDQVHSSVQRCIEQLGLGTQHLRVVPSDDRCRMEVEKLTAMIEADRKAGLRPMAVVASAGTTNVGAIDPLERIADACDKTGLWLHVDGAYGGFAGLDPEYAEALAGIAQADSVTVDPHKWLHVPLDCGALLTRHKALHREAFTLTPDYLEKGDEHAVPWPYEYRFQLTYANRAIKTWAAVARLGKEGVATLVIRCNRLAANLSAMVQSANDLELLAPTSLSVVNFRYVPPGQDFDNATLDELNERISTRIADSGEAHLPTTKVNGHVSLRACILHYENDDDDVAHLLELVRRFGTEWAD